VGEEKKQKAAKEENSKRNSKPGTEIRKKKGKTNREKGYTVKINEKREERPRPHDLPSKFWVLPIVKKNSEGTEPGNVRVKGRSAKGTRRG